MEYWERRIVADEQFHVGWQLGKAAGNLRKHLVSFAEAITVLDDPWVRSEPQIVAGEQREKLIGRSNAGRLLAVAVFIQAPGDDEGAEALGFIRVMSARRATPNEEALYLS